MAVEFPELTTLDPEQIAALQTLLTERLQAYAPEIDYRRGVVHDIILHLRSVVGTGHLVLVDQTRLSMSLQTISANPELATDEIVDAVLANFRVVRSPGAKASGRIAVVLSKALPLVIPSTTQFTANSLTFTVSSAFTVRTSASTVVNATDRLLQPVGDGNFIFTVDVVADEPGAAGQLTSGTKLEPVTSISSFVNAYADGDFTGGVDVDTNASLITKLQEGISARLAANDIAISAILKDDDRFADLQTLSVRGYGDPEQNRYHGLLPIAFGGRLDVYLQTRALPLEETIAKTATLITKNDSNQGTWRFSLARDDAPGFYDVLKIVQKDSDVSSQTGYEITSDTRGLDLTAAEGLFIPDIATAAEAAFTRFQTTIIEFLDTDTDVAALDLQSQRDYSVVVRRLPLLAEAHDVLNSRSSRHAAADLLVRGAVPAFAAISMLIKIPNAADLPDTAAIQTDIADAVNHSGFAGRLPVSLVTHRAHNHLPDGSSVEHVELTASLRYPDGRKKYLRSLTLLEAPEDPKYSVSRKTSLFFLKPEDVAVSYARLPAV